MAEHSDLTIRIARLAHECWCLAMEEDGWAPGDHYDPEAGVHDALRPFDELSPFDRDCVACGILFEELQDGLAGSIRLTRGPDREFTAAEMRVGLRVRTSSRGLDDAKISYGHVRSWTVQDPEVGRLDTIRVEWEDGMVVDHPACAGELARVDED